MITCVQIFYCLLKKSLSECKLPLISIHVTVCTRIINITFYSTVGGLPENSVEDRAHAVIMGTKLKFWLWRVWVFDVLVSFMKVRDCSLFAGTRYRSRSTSKYEIFTSDIKYLGVLLKWCVSIGWLKFAL